MAGNLATKKRNEPRPSVRLGRPPRTRAGQVEKRILDAACRVFLTRGFDGATVDEIAEVARSGKPTIYARYPNKEALFVAAYGAGLAAANTRIASCTPAGTTIAERLESFGVLFLREAFRSEWIGLMRLAIAESRRFPGLGSSIVQITRERGSSTMTRLQGECAESIELGAPSAASPNGYGVAAQCFADLVLLPLLLRALAGEELETLDSEIPAHVLRRVAFFLAAYRLSGGK